MRISVLRLAGLVAGAIMLATSSPADAQRCKGNACEPQIQDQNRKKAAAITQVGRFWCHPMGLSGPWIGIVAFGNPKVLASYRRVGEFKVDGQCGWVYGPIGSFACVTVLERGIVRRYWVHFNMPGQKDASAKKVVVAKTPPAARPKLPPTVLTGIVAVPTASSGPGPLVSSSFRVILGGMCSEGEGVLFGGAHDKWVVSECMRVTNGTIELPLYQNEPPRRSLERGVAVLVEARCQKIGTVRIVMGGTGNRIRTPSCLPLRTAKS